MKKIVLIMLISVMLVSPCFAQIKPQGLFSINDTLWETACEVEEGICLDKTFIGFSESKVYLSSVIWDPTECEQTQIFNLAILTFYSASCESFGESTSNISGVASSLLGVGIYRKGEPPNAEIEIIEKIENDWNPSEPPSNGGPPIIIIPIPGFPDDIYDNPIEPPDYTLP